MKVEKALYLYLFFGPSCLNLTPHTPTHTISVIYVEIKQQPYTDPISSSK